MNRSPVSTSPFRQVQPAKRARLLLVRPNVNSGLCAMAKYGEINSGSWVVNGEERLEVCGVVYGDDMVEARRKVCAFGRGEKADDGQVRHGMGGKAHADSRRSANIRLIALTSSTSVPCVLVGEA